MTHTIVITTTKQAVAELSDEEYQEYVDMDFWEKEEYLDIWISDSDTIERTIEEV